MILFRPRSMPVFIDKASMLLGYLKSLDYFDLKKLYAASDKLTLLNFNRLKDMDLTKDLSPAIFSFQGLQYKYMGPNVFTDSDLDYVDEHLRILSGFYGLLRPFDGIVPHRLEMGSRIANWTFSDLYSFWSSLIAEELSKETDLIIDLASKEYSYAVTKHLDKSIRLIEIVFGELTEGKVIEKGTLAKMARGQIVRFMAENKIKREEEIKEYNGFGYRYRRELSGEEKWVFIKEKKWQDKKIYSRKEQGL